MGKLEKEIKILHVNKKEIEIKYVQEHSGQIISGIFVARKYATDICI